MGIKENHHAAEEEKTSERSVKVLLSGMFSRKKKKKKGSSSPPNEDARLMMRGDKTNNKNVHMSLSEMMRKLKHSFKKEKPQHDNNKRLLVLRKKKGKSLSTTTTTKNHFFIERMASISQKLQQHHVVKEKHNLLSENGDSDQHLAASEEAHGRIVSLLPGYSSPFRSPGKIWDQNPTLLSRSASDNFMKSETLAEIEERVSLSQDSSSPSVSSSSHNFVTFEISQLGEASDVDKDDESSHEERLPQPSLLFASSPSHYISRTDEYELVLDPLFIGYEISPARAGEAKRQTLCNQFEEKDDDPMDEKETVFKYVKGVLGAIDSSWEEMHLKTEFSDQILNPALFNNIQFYPSRLCAADHDHELLFDSINELIFEFCRFPQWVSFVKPITQVFSFSSENFVDEVQKEVYCRLFPLQFADSVDHIIREDMDKGGNWLDDVRSEVECIGFETSELILNELLEQLMLDML
ncbi:unnamed protein product [Brassica rapa]|uniref:DUF4378 domain-containing protein n=1 Tax=Brassica campestris TaxID=3711 RepID=A0A3P5YXK2_BRACM|nr:unnamed protein product [Brassica rapa]VDC64648.1 unnamed protein product [Brassica rapa]